MFSCIFSHICTVKQTFVSVAVNDIDEPFNNFVLLAERMEIFLFLIDLLVFIIRVLFKNLTLIVLDLKSIQICQKNCLASASNRYII